MMPTPITLFARPITVLSFALAVLSLPATADETPPKATVTIVGDADRFNIGQNGYCGKRNEVSHPSNALFRIPSAVPTYFYIHTKFLTELADYYCEGDFSFVPEPAHLHIIRYTFSGSTCLLEIFSSTPEGTPQPLQFKREPTQNCLSK
jgi:hypothetical protein